MEKFKKDLVAKMILLWLAVLAANTVYWVFSAVKGTANDYTRGFGSGLCAVLIIYAVVTSFRLYMLTIDEKKLDELYRKSTDERYALIREKTASGSFTVSSFIICLGAIVTSFFSKEITIVLTGILLAMLIVWVLLKIYYERKY